MEKEGGRGGGREESRKKVRDAKRGGRGKERDGVSREKGLKTEKERTRDDRG